MMAAPTKQQLERPSRCQYCEARLPFGCGLYVGNYGPLCARCEPQLRQFEEASHAFNRREREKEQRRFSIIRFLVYGACGSASVWATVELLRRVLRWN